jgi:hypothetical protein
LEKKKGDENEEEGTGDASMDVMNQLLGQPPTISKKRGITEVEVRSTTARGMKGKVLLKTRSQVSMMMIRRLRPMKNSVIDCHYFDCEYSRDYLREPKLATGVGIRRSSCRV